jgi:hypothetical protein
MFTEHAVFKTGSHNRLIIYQTRYKKQTIYNQKNPTMKTILLILALLPLLHIPSPAQSPAGVVYPGKSLTNRCADTLYYMTAAKVRNLLAAQDSLLHLQKINQLLTAKNAVLDSIAEYSRQMISLKEEEAVYWKQELMANDRELENCQVQNALLGERLRKMKRNRRWYWVAGGVMAGAIIIGR